MNTDEKPCPRCVNGRVKCRRCNGSGKPPLHACHAVEKEMGRCMVCLGATTVMCPTCGGVQVVRA